MSISEVLSCHLGERRMSLDKGRATVCGDGSDTRGAGAGERVEDKSALRHVEAKQLRAQFHGFCCRMPVGVSNSGNLKNMLLVPQYVVGGQHIRWPPARSIRLVVRIAIEIVRVDPPLGSVKRVCAARSFSVAFVPPRDPRALVNCCRRRFARYPRHRDGHECRSCLSTRPRTPIRKYPGVHALDLEAGVGETIHDKVIDPIIRHDHDSTARLHGGQEGAPKGEGRAAGVPRFAFQDSERRIGHDGIEMGAWQRGEDLQRIPLDQPNIFLARGQVIPWHRPCLTKTLRSLR